MVKNYTSTKRNINRQGQHKQKTINRINNHAFVCPIDFFDIAEFSHSRHVECRGIFSNSRGEYTLTFVQDSDDRCFIVMPMKAQ